MTGSSRKSALASRLDAINEFDREPVSKDRLRGPGGFIGLYAGEHVAGTEFVIGPLFVAHGVATGDLLLGLLVGNLLAVLSWAFLCAPIATRTRLNLYWRLRKITGPNLLFVYNIVNALMFCFLAGAMISVAATAVGIPFDMPMPGLSDLYPNSAAWVVTVLVVGSVVTVLAVLGFDKIARFSKIASPPSSSCTVIRSHVRDYAPMTAVLKILSYGGLALTVVPAVLVLAYGPGARIRCSCWWAPCCGLRHLRSGWIAPVLPDSLPAGIRCAVPSNPYSIPRIALTP